MTAVAHKNLSKLLVKVVLNNGVSMALTFAFYTFVSSALLDRGYGNFFYVISLILVAVMLSELGINISLHKRGNNELESESTKVSFGNALFLKFSLALFATSVIIFFNFISPEFYFIYFFGLSVSILYNHLLTFFQSVQREESYLTPVICGGVLRMIVILLLWMLNMLSVNLIVFSFFLPQFFVILVLIRRSSTYVFKINTDLLRSLIIENTALHLLTFVVALLVRMEFLILKEFGNEKDLNLFSLFFTYSMLIPPLIAAVNSTLLVRISSFASYKDYLVYVRRLVFIMSLIMLFVALLIVFYLNKYLAMNYNNIILFIIIYFAILSTLIVKPWGLLLHYFNMEATILLINSVQLLIGFILGVIMYKKHGLLGIVAAFGMQQILANVFIFTLANSAAKDKF